MPLMKKPQLIDELKRLGIEFDENLKYHELLKLLPDKQVETEPVKEPEIEIVPPPQPEPVVETVKESVLEFQSVLSESEAQYNPRHTFEEYQLQHFILSNKIHGKVLRVETIRSYVPEKNGSFITKYKVFKKE